MAAAIIAPTNLPASRKEAAAQSSRHYFTGRPCRYDHIDKRLTSTGQCLTCKQEWAARPENRAKKNSRAADYHVENLDSRRAASRLHYQKNKATKLACGKAYRESHRPQFAQWMAEWRAKNPERALLTRRLAQSKRRAGQMDSDNAAIRRWVVATPKVCHWCGAKCKAHYHIDHYVPLARGGRHEISNLVIACKKCNLSKSSKDPHEFAASIGRLF